MKATWGAGPAAFAKCPKGITSIAVTITMRCIASGRRTTRRQNRPTVTAGLSPDVYPDIRSYSSTPGKTLTRSACLSVGQSCHGLQPTGTPKQFGSCCWPTDLTPPRGSGIREDLQVLTHAAVRKQALSTH